MKIEHEVETGGSGGTYSWKNGDMEKEMEHELETCLCRGLFLKALWGTLRSVVPCTSAV